MLGTDNITIIKQSNATDCHISEQLLSTTAERTKHIYKFVWAVFATAVLKCTLALCITVEKLGRPSSNNMPVTLLYL